MLIMHHGLPEELEGGGVLSPERRIFVSLRERKHEERTIYMWPSSGCSSFLGGKFMSVASLDGGATSYWKRGEVVLWA